MQKKNIFLVWLGNRVPMHAQFAYESYRTLNLSANTFFVHKTIDQIENGKPIDKIDRILKDSCEIILNRNQSIRPYIDNQLKLYGKNARFIQVLSDVFRVILVQKLGGIYVDCDTFPVKSFDDRLLSQPFCVLSHQSASTEAHIDNYFFGMPKKSSFVPYDSSRQNMHLIEQTFYGQQSSIDYYARKMKFKKGMLSQKDFPKDFPFYIEHYPSQNWKTMPSKIPLCKYDLLEYRNIWLHQ